MSKIYTCIECDEPFCADCDKGQFSDVKGHEHEYMCADCYQATLEAIRNMSLEDIQEALKQ